jgi:hypothetical protein
MVLRSLLVMSKSKHLQPAAMLERIAKLTARVKQVDVLIESHTLERSKLVEEVDHHREELQAYLARARESLNHVATATEAPRPVAQPTVPRRAEIKVSAGVKNRSGWMAHSLQFLANRGGKDTFLDEIATHCTKQLRQGLLMSSVHPDNKVRLNNNVSVALNAAKKRGFVENDGTHRPWKITRAGKKYVALLRDG